MSDFNSEYKELHEWYKEKLSSVEHLPEDGTGQDGGQRGNAEKKVDIEYRSKLQLLKDKYNVA